MSEDLPAEIATPTIVDYFSLEEDRFVSTAQVEVILPDLLSAQKVNGRRNLYNGPVQKEIEKMLKAHLHTNPEIDDVRLQVLTRTPLEELDFGPREVKHLERLDDDSKRAKQILKRATTVKKCMTENNVNFLLWRDGHIIGPSPALAHALAEISMLLPRRARVFDPFAGTFLTRGVLARIRPDLEVIAYDRLESNRQSTDWDAFLNIKEERWDLIVVDPLYEDLLTYVREVLAILQPSRALIQTGETKDSAWNRAALRLLKGMAKVEVLDGISKRFGKQIVVASF